jgi:hypothetical protein
MRLHLLLWLFSLLGLFETACAAPAQSATTRSISFSTAESSKQSGTSSQFENRVIIPGPLPSFLRMAGLRQRVSSQEVLPLLARNVLLHGYQTGRPTEYLILLRRYYRQAEELSALAGPDGNIRVNGCNEAGPLLSILGYTTRGECGRTGMALVAVDPKRAFLTIDSGFPLVDLEEALQKAAPFAYAYSGSAVPVLFSPADWEALAGASGQSDRDVVVIEMLLYEADLARLYWALSRIDPETRAALRNDVGLENLRPLAPALDHYGSQICIRAGALVVPGGRNAEKEWQGLVGASPEIPAEFIPELLKKDRGWLAAYYDAMARANQRQQEHFAEGQRLKHFYEAFRSPGTSTEAAAKFVFRPAAGLMVLVTRLRWGANNDPYVPGSLQAWSEILRQNSHSRIIRDWAKRSSSWHHPDQLVEAMFAFSRLDTDTGPLQAYLCLSELDHERPPGQRMSNQTVVLLADKFADFSDQYLIFSEFPELTDVSITRFLTTAEALNNISDRALRGNAMGTFQAAVGLWQILARQGQIDRSRLNSSWQAVIGPFTRFATPAQLFTAGRSSIEAVFRAATGKASLSHDEMINALAAAHQTTAGGQRMQLEMANRIRSVLEDQRLVSLDTLFALDDGLDDSGQGPGKKDMLIALAGELREFEMPQPIFTSGERTTWAAGTYNNRHTEGEMRTNLARVFSSPPSPKQRAEARGQLATFLRDTIVGMNYAYYEPPGSQALHHNPLFVRSHDFSGDTVTGVEQLWQAPQLFGVGLPAGGGAHLVGSLADLPYVLAEAEQDFIAPDHVQALIWQQIVPGLLSSAIVPRWWDVSQNELHAAALYQRAGEELLMASTGDTELRGRVMAVVSDRMFPARWAWLEETIRTGKTKEMLDGIMPAETFYLTAEFQQRFPGDLSTVSSAGRELEALSRENPDKVSRERISRDFGIIHPVFAQNYTPELLIVKPFPALTGTYSRLMAECWDSGNLYWARLADEMGYSPVLLNRMVPELTRRMVEKIFASELEDWPAILAALQETGEEFRQGKVPWMVGSMGKPRSETK